MKEYMEYLNEYMRNDRVTISREMEVKDSIGADVYENVNVAEDVPCHLSQNSQKSLTISSGGGIAQTSAELRLYTAPDVDIQAGDILTVTTAGNQVFLLEASRKFVYPTHLEVTCTYTRESSERDET